MPLRYALQATVMAAALMLPGLAAANDSSGFQGTTGIELATTDAVRMVSEDLRIGLDAINISYVFENVTDLPVETMVVFPLPDLDLSPGLTASNWNFPAEADDFLGFELWINDQPLKPSLERRAFYQGKDVTDQVKAAGALGLVPWKSGGYDEQAKSLPPAGLAALRRAGLIQNGDNDNNPQWQLRSRYFWRQTFPPHSEVKIRHRYHPFVGTALIEKADQIKGNEVVGRLIGEPQHDGQDRYCIDDGTRRALAAAERQAAKKNPNKSDSMAFDAAEIEYILTTARNWRGPIGRFHLTIDKGAPDNILSLCWNGLTKTGPTTFETTLTDFVPQQDIRLLVFVRSKP